MKSYTDACSHRGFENLKSYSSFHIFRRKLYYKRIIKRHFKDCERILDVGCGIGTFMEVAHGMGKDVKGIDANSYCVAHCREQGLDAEVRDVYDMNFNEEFDAVFCSQFIEHVVEPFLVMEKMHSALKKGGKLFIITHCPNDKFWDEPTHVRPYTKKGLKRLFEWSCFRVLKVWHVIGTGNVIAVGEKL